MIRRFFCDHIPEVDETVVLSEMESYHIQTVVRKSSDELIVLLDGNGIAAVAKILGWHSCRQSTQVVCQILRRKCHSPPKTRILLYISPPKSQGIRQIIRQSTELGVSEVIPLITEFSVSKPEERSLSKWQQDAREACKQCGNVFLPEIHAPKSLDHVLRRVVEPGIVGAAPNSEGADVGDAGICGLTSAERALSHFHTARIGAWVGPEGGFTSNEQEAIIKRGILPVTIGPWTLRVETAVVACITWINLYIGTKLENQSSKWNR